jgi:phage terminase large subunit
LLAGSVIPLSEWGEINQTEITMPDGSKALGLSTNEGVRFQGWHARPGSFLLLIGDEAPGVRPDISRRGRGSVRVEMFGFCFSVTRSSRAARSSTSSPPICPGGCGSPSTHSIPPTCVDWICPDCSHRTNLSLDVSERPYLVTRRWVRDRYHEWGVDHPLWQSRVRGQFPLQSDDALLSLAWLEAAARRPAAYDPEQPVQAGVDVAGPGEDETVLCVRQGDAILELKSWAQADPRGAVIAALNEWRDRGLEAVNVDVAGIGHYFERALGDAGLPVSRINVGEAPTGDNKRTTEQAKEKFANLRAQVFWSFREWAAEGMLSGLTDQTTLAQLAGIRYEHDNRGKVAIEKKADARKRGVKSPDRAEAVVLAFWKSAPKNRLEGVFAKAMAPTRPPITLDPNRPPGLTDAQWRYFEEQARRKRSEW